jgi:short-subunit dehydrogenase
MAKPIGQQVVVITGASSGIGRETALRLASKGARVILSARAEEPLDDLVSEITSAGGKAVAIPADVSLYEDMRSLASGAVDQYGRIDTWVNNAGQYLVGEFEKTNLEEARRLFDVNFWGEVHGTKAALEVMRRQGEGTIVNVTSVTAERALPLTSFYSASKGALNALFGAIQSELTDDRIKVSIVMPASIDTPLFAHARTKEGVQPQPYPPIYPPSEVASAIQKMAEDPRSRIFAGPAGWFFAAGNQFAPGLLNRFLRATKSLVLSDKPPVDAKGNLYASMNEQVPPTETGGWRGRRYKLAEFAARAVAVVGALFLVRRLVGKR